MKCNISDAFSPFLYSCRRMPRDVHETAMCVKVKPFAISAFLNAKFSDRAKIKNVRRTAGRGLKLAALQCWH